MEIVKLMIQQGANNWNAGMEDACRGGHMNIVKLMIEKGATSFDDGFVGACISGQIDIAKLMLSKGARSLQQGFDISCEYGHIELVKLIIDKAEKSHIVLNFEEGMKFVCINGYLYIIKLLINEIQRTKNKDQTVQTRQKQLWNKIHHNKKKGYLPENLYKFFVNILSFHELFVYKQYVFFPEEISEMILRKWAYMSLYLLFVPKSENLFPVLKKYVLKHAI